MTQGTKSKNSSMNAVLVVAGRREMDPRTMNRRSLWKSLVPIVMTALASSPTRAFPEGDSKPCTRAQPGRVQQDRQDQWMVCISKRLDPCEPPLTFLRGTGVQQDKQRPVICILRRQSPGTRETFLKECDADGNVVS
jgi:hypothetical protein